MKILFTGASSFTGMWFIEELMKCGHQVTALFRQKLDSYADVRLERVHKVLQSSAKTAFECAFGSPAFFDVLETASWDLLCYHGAETKNYKSADFDVLAAVQSNTYRLREVLKRNIKKVVLTDSIFSPGEGMGSESLRAVSPYGVSKGLTTQLVRYYCHEMNIPLSRFVIPNPFGPYEEPRFVDYLMRQWMQRKVAQVQTPLYVRDNIHVSLLAKCYAEHCISKAETVNPSCYVESQSQFAERLALAMRPRLDLPCEYDCLLQLKFIEPAVRVNTDPVNRFQWDEESSWNEFAEYYKQRYPVLVPA